MPEDDSIAYGDTDVIPSSDSGVSAADWDNNHMKPPVIDDDRRRAVRTDILTTLASRSGSPTSEVVTATTLRALYRHHPRVALEDVLELRVLIDPDGTDPETPLGDRVDAVLEAALTELTVWNVAPAVSI